MPDDTVIVLPTRKEYEHLYVGKKVFNLTIDGRALRAPEGTLLLDAMREIGIEVPAMCYHYTFSSFGSCGICLVEVEGKNNNVRACTAKITDHMIVRTQTAKMEDARKKAVEKHLTTHPLDCPVCDADGKCELQDMAYDLGVYDIKKATRKNIPEDTRSVALDFNMERCILCAQCINVCKEVQEIDALAFYKKDGKTHVGAKGGEALYCEFCGDCLAVCPVGAIVSRFSKYAYKPWQLKKTETTCTYCSDGCKVTLESQDDRVTRVTSKLSYLSKYGHGATPGESHGGICVRGRFGFQMIQSGKRLSRPLVRVAKDEPQIEIPWFKAIPLVAKRLSEIKAQHGGASIAGLIGARCTNEEVYLFQRLMRTVCGTNAIDTTARYGHMNSVCALQNLLGVGASTTSFKNIALSDVVMVIGADVTETHPVFSLRIKEAKSKFRAKVIVADRIETHLRKLCTHPLPLEKSGEGALILGLIRAVIQGKHTDPKFMLQYPDAYEAIAQSVLALSENDIVKTSGLSWEKIEEAARLLASAERGNLIWGEGITACPQGYQNVLRLIDLAMLVGLFHKAGSGVHPICEENNEQGAVDMGGVPEFLPGQVSYRSMSQRTRFASAWNASLPDPSPQGGTLTEIIERAHAGHIHALWIVGENPLASLPQTLRVDEALSKIDWVICQDPFMTASGERADLVLPAVTFAEKSGTFTSMEGKVNKVLPALEPRGEARPDWKIFRDVAKQMGHPLSYRSVEEIQDEIETLVPGYFAGICPAIHERTRYMDADFVSEIPARYRLSVAPVDTAYPYRLHLHQVLYHSGKLSMQDSALMRIYSAPRLAMSSADAKTLDVQTDDSVCLRSVRGVVECRVEIKENLPEGDLQFPEHFAYPEMSDLLSVEIDPITHVPYFKSCNVHIEKVVRDALTVIESYTGEGAQCAVPDQTTSHRQGEA